MNSEVLLTEEMCFFFRKKKIVSEDLDASLKSIQGK